MSKPWEDENCDDVFAYYSIYPIPVAAALWCNIPPNEVNKYLDNSTEITPGIWRHPRVKCLEAKCRAMHAAIVTNNLQASRENGMTTTDHIAPARRHVSRQHLKDWIAKEFPGNKPPFLFDEIERKTHPAINAAAYQSLQADLAAAHSENERLLSLTQKLTDERDDLRGQIESLKAIVEKNAALAPRSETTLLNIIGCMLKLMLSTSPAGKPHSIFTSQAMIISSILAYFQNVPGISDRTLEQKFADANRSLSSA